jgi:hypothetical protein
MIPSNTMPFQMAGATTPNTQMFPQQMNAYGGAGAGFSGGMPMAPSFGGGGTSPMGFGGMPPAPNFGGNSNGAMSQGPTIPGNIYGHDAITAWQNGGSPPTGGGMPQSFPSQQPPSGGFSLPGPYQSPTYSPGMNSPSSGWGSYSQAASQTNPYLQSQISGLQQQYNNNLTRNVLPAIQSGANAVGGIGGARQGIAQGLAMGDSQAGFANAAANLLGSDYENSQNRALQAYQGDQNNSLGYLNSDRNYSTQMGNLGLGYQQANQGYDLGLRNNSLGYFNGQNSYNLGTQANQNSANQIANNYALGNQGNNWTSSTSKARRTSSVISPGCKGSKSAQTTRGLRWRTSGRSPALTRGRAPRRKTARKAAGQWVGSAVLWARGKSCK